MTNVRRSIRRAVILRLGDFEAFKAGTLHLLRAYRTAPVPPHFSPRRGPILLQFWTENFNRVYPLLDLENTLLNGREAAV